ncbi:hypothetical protein [Arthrobacter sp. NIO-1057]|uniref:hypothetical protein n=1 Tax=Arthrobacter sp. NIO-1057 TaxID=993071 RepID=UPI00071DE516|nr:hypothetical protein [Arthrobacter sp. NIO-1057]KSU68070.1 hypothetical protein AS038_02975 [Arthrobacter sp. NIO-1057]SCB87565.1 hypothetical protein GA0061084_0603 [Arthrobacter sp. NIO-1057]
MLNLSGENSDDELTYLLSPTVESHQVVTIGSAEDLGRNSASGSESSLAMAGNTDNATSQYGSLDDWF